MPTSTQSNTDTLTGLLAHLVQFPTVTNDQSTNIAALDWVQTQLQGLPLRIQRLTSQGFPTLIATTPAVKNPKNPRLWLAAHIDVVGASHEDFLPTLHEGRFYGRGSHDMKYAIASYILLMKQLGADLSKYNLGMLLTSDEEHGGENGVGWLVNDLGYRGEAVLLPDSSTAWQFGLGGKGIMRWEIEASGRAAHGSRPWQGVNAIEEIMKFTKLLQSHVPTEPCGSNDHRHNSVVLATIRGGEAPNQVPGTATATIDMRFTADSTPEQLTGWVNDAITKMPTISATNSIMGLPYKISASSPAAKQFKDCVREVLGHDIPDHMAHGSSDGRWFAWKGVTDLNIGITGSGYHTSPEWIEIADLNRFHQTVRYFVDRWVKPAD